MRVKINFHPTSLRNRKLAGWINMEEYYAEFDYKRQYK